MRACVQPMCVCVCVCVQSHGKRPGQLILCSVRIRFYCRLKNSQVSLPMTLNKESACDKGLNESSAGFMANFYFILFFIQENSQARKCETTHYDTVKLNQPISNMAAPGYRHTGRGTL